MKFIVLIIKRIKYDLGNILVRDFGPKKMRKRKNGINKIETCLPITRFISIKFENI